MSLSLSAGKEGPLPSGQALAAPHPHPTLMGLSSYAALPFSFLPQVVGLAASHVPGAFFLLIGTQHRDFRSNAN